MRYQTMPGIPVAYIEASYRGHKAIPGDYELKLKLGDQIRQSPAKILPNPLYPTTGQEYAEYHTVMSEMEQSLTTMHDKTNRLYKIQVQLKKLLGSLPRDDAHEQLREQGKARCTKNLKPGTKRWFSGSPRLTTMWRTTPTSLPPSIFF